MASALVSYPGGHRSEEKGWRRSRTGLQCRPAGIPAPSAAMTERTDQPSWRGDTWVCGVLHQLSCYEWCERRYGLARPQRL